MHCLTHGASLVGMRRGRAGRELSLRPRSPREALTAVADPAGVFSDLPTEAIPLAVGENMSPQDQGEAEEGVSRGPHGAHQKLRFH